MSHTQCPLCNTAARQLYYYYDDYYYDIAGYHRCLTNYYNLGHFLRELLLSLSLVLSAILVYIVMSTLPNQNRIGP